MPVSYYVILLIFPFLLGLWAQWRVKRAFGTYSRVRANSNITGAQAAREVLAAAQIHDVEVVEIESMLGDHYDPTNKRLCLSGDVYNTPSVAALGIAAHEAGHAIQHARHYAPLYARMAVVPATQFVSQALPFLLIGSVFIPLIPFAFAIKIAAYCYVVIAAFQLITLPVEFDASRRAKIVLQEMGMISPGEEATGVNRVLDAAALTYVAAFVAAVAQMAYYFLLARSRD